MGMDGKEIHRTQLSRRLEIPYNEARWVKRISCTTATEGTVCVQLMKAAVFGAIGEQIFA